MSVAATTSDPTPDSRVRWWEPVVAFVGGNALGTLAAIVVAVIGFGIAITRGWVIPGMRPALSALLSTNFAVVMGALVLNNLAMLGVIWWLVRRRSAGPLGVYFPAASWITVLLAAGSGVAVSLVLNGGNQLAQNAGWFAFTDTPTELAMVPHGAVQFAVSLFTVTLLAPFVEEFLFRGLLMRWLLPFARVTGAVLVSALIFGLIHGQVFLHPGVQGWILTVELALAGVVLGLWAARTGTLRTSFATHAAFNLTATIFSVLLT